jgi:hypothetical protein
LLSPHMLPVPPKSSETRAILLLIQMIRSVRSLVWLGIASGEASQGSADARCVRYRGAKRTLPNVDHERAAAPWQGPAHWLRAHDVTGHA